MQSAGSGHPISAFAEAGGSRIPSKTSHRTGSKQSKKSSEARVSDSNSLTEVTKRPRDWSKRPSVHQYAEGNRNISREPSKATYQTIGFVIIAALTYVALLFVFELHYFLPFDSGFAVVILWGSSMLGGQIAKFVGLPQLLGMLVAGIILKNCGDPVRGLEASWGAGVRAFGLMNILMRGGLEMDLDAVKRLGFAVIRLTVLPGVTEAFVSSLFGMLFFDMPFFLALSLGFILAAVSPAVVVGGMFDLQSRGYGVDQGVPSLVVAAASFDDVVAISGFSMCIGLAIGTGDIVMEALHGPINIIGGTIFGLLGALVLSATKVWDNHVKRSLALLLLGLVFTFSSKLAHFAGAGALASLVMAAGASRFWANGVGGFMCKGQLPCAAHEVEEDLCKVWSAVAEPLLFSIIGAALDFSKVSAATIPKAVCLIIIGVAFRVCAAYFATFGAGLRFKERLFIALAWMPKATVQAALGSVPLDMARNTLDESEDPEKYAKYMTMGTEILTTAVFSILVTAPVGLIVIQQLGPRWLEKEKEPNTVEGFDDFCDDCASEEGGGRCASDAAVQSPKSAASVPDAADVAAGGQALHSAATASHDRVPHAHVMHLEEAPGVPGAVKIVEA